MCSARHASLLGIDPAARTGRLATARRVAKLLRDISAETDDVVVVGMVAEAEVGDIGDSAAGTAFKQASAVTQALAGTQWTLLEAIATRASHDERARVILDELHTVAVADEAVYELGPALDAAVTRAAALLAADAAPGPGAGGPPPAGSAGAQRVEARRAARADGQHRTGPDRRAHGAGDVGGAAVSAVTREPVQATAVRRKIESWLREDGPHSAIALRARPEWTDDPVARGRGAHGAGGRVPDTAGRPRGAARSRPR